MAGVTITALDAAGATCVGCFHPPEPVHYPDGAWTARELELLRAHPALEVADGEPEPEAPPSLTAAQIAWLRSLTPSHLERLAVLDRDWIDRLVAVTNLGAEQVDRLVDLESDGVQALLFPSTPTVQAALDTALGALRRATPDEVREFFRTMAEDPEIAGKVESEISRQEQLIAAIAGLEAGNEAHWTKSGEPRTDALEAATGLESVSGAERDAAWEEYEKAKASDA